MSHNTGTNANATTTSLSKLREMTLQLLNKELDQSEKLELYETIINSTLDGILILDGNNNIVYCNLRMAQILATTPSALEGTSYFNYINTSDYQKARHNLTQRRLGISDVYVFNYRRVDGSDAFCQVSSKPVFDSQGNYKGVISSVSELTNGKLSRAQRLMMFDISVDPMVVFGVDGDIKEANEAFITMLGYTKAEIIGSHWSRFIHPDDLDSTKEHGMEFYKNPDKLYSNNNRYIAKDGTIIPLKWRARGLMEYKLIFATARINESEAIESGI